MSFSGLTIKTFIVLKRRYALSLRLRSLFSMGARFVFQLCAVFLEGSTLIAVHIKIIISLCRRTAQHIHILLAFHQKRAGWKNSIFDGAASLIVSAAAFHGVKIPQRGIRLFSQPIHGAVISALNSGVFSMSFWCGHQVVKNCLPLPKSPRRWPIQPVTLSCSSVWEWQRS